MIRRIAPHSDDRRAEALLVCRTQADALGQARWLITQEQYEAVGAALEGWREVRGAVRAALARQAEATRACDAAFDACATAATHFMHVVNLAIRRGRLEPAARVGYGLPLHRARVPVMNTTDGALQWVERLAAGEAQRVGAGGVPLAWPDIGEVTAAGAVLYECEAALSTAKDAYDNAQEAVAAQRPGVQALLRDVGDTVEFHLRRQDAPSRRRVAREWGVLYVTRPANKRRKADAAPAEAAEAAG